MAEDTDAPANEARKAIQERIDAFVESDIRGERIDVTTPDFTLKLPDGQVFGKQELEQNMERDRNEIISISPDTRIAVEDIALEGEEATVRTSQCFVRTVRGRDDKPHEVITSVIHREIWVRTPAGWFQKHIEELEQGPTFVDGELYDIS